MARIDTRHLLTMRCDVDSTSHLGAVPQGYERRIVTVSGGTFEGHDLRGRIRPGGGDFLTIRSDGAYHLDVRLVLETDGGELIYMTYIGRRNGPPEVMARYKRNEAVGADEDYFRTIVQFETAAPRLLRLNDLLAVGTGSRTAQGPIYEIFEVL
ncbi:DUF3237 domain-containing protein [Pseudooceanicola pacificus]|nr:DUF3237 domain-containing protein [Pseudooceanicola pacificus]